MGWSVPAPGNQDEPDTNKRQEARHVLYDNLALLIAVTQQRVSPVCQNPVPEKEVEETLLKVLAPSQKE